MGGGKGSKMYSIIRGNIEEGPKSRISLTGGETALGVIMGKGG